ncbi:UDP-N-acetylmuramoyl-L-alanyl-D-glutamate--2,6-diaminopimelate ligase [Propionicimonas sp. T2.31MG-18]|uniref:UDP-N-acetylmuramoyl-L-alanyl-D-glutamate--2, 6-diaminopimelate ligase n=1 Tax=Propionicimonas sp. T2.31MG-18 TaxID=3157620 RepID=UPI0035EE6B3F
MTTTPAVLRPSATPGTLLDDLLPGSGRAVVTGITLDSRGVLPGDLYVALPGRTVHGAAFAAQAVAGGAAAVLTDTDGAALLAGIGVPVAVVPDPRTEMARVAADLYGRPGDRLDLFGVTGTAGKTSTTFLLAAALSAAGHSVGTIGTIGFALDGRPLASGRTTVTTPESPDLQALLGYLAEHGADTVAMEVSSHALALHRVDELVFDVAGFTNLGRDHLDFHAGQEDYFQAKARLFRDGRCRAAVVNTDDEYGRRLAAELAAGAVPLATTGSTGDYRVTRREPAADGSSVVTLATPGGERTFVLGLLGEFNARNAATAAAMLDLAGVDLDVALPGLATAFVPGRMQRVDLGPAAPGVVVDFAHTPEAVTAALEGLPPGRRIAVLGCGGDRDQAKRGPMGAAAAAAASVVVVTDDNPRSESPEAIRRAVLAGAREVAASSGAQVHDGGSRADAIRLALGLARPGDWVAVLGKGHESGQQLADRTIPFDDVRVVTQAWAEVRGTDA